MLNKNPVKNNLYEKKPSSFILHFSEQGNPYGEDMEEYVAELLRDYDWQVAYSREEFHPYANEEWFERWT